MPASWVRPLAAADATCGHKAANLARLIAAGVPVPDGFVVDARAFRHVAGETHASELDAIGHALGQASERLETAELPPALVDAIRAAVAALGDTRLVVRSSSTREDADTGAAAGVFASIVDVKPADVLAAIRAVWTSALTPLAASYSPHDGAAHELAVIVQRFECGDRVTAYTRPPGAPERDELWLEGPSGLIKLTRASDDPAAVLAVAAEQAIGAAGGADVELVLADDVIHVVQARPIVHALPHAQVAPPAMLLAPLEADGRTWTLDVAHNPEPLSLAQSQLVELVELAGFAPWSMRVVAGYLYTTSREQPESEPRALRAIERDIERVLDDDRTLRGGDAAVLDDAIERYLAFYRLWAREIVPRVRAARARADADQLRGARISAVEVTLIAAARGEIDLLSVTVQLGFLSPAWDVAVPTFAEAPYQIVQAIVRTKLALASLPAPPDAYLDGGELDLGERDDHWFARAQWVVRRAILLRADALRIPHEDAFWLPFEELRRDTVDLDDIRRRAAAARAAATRAATWTMPIVIGDSRTEHGPALTGLGAGGSARGRVVRLGAGVFARTVTAVTRNDVVVVRAVTPALAVLIAGAAALVSETGGLLDHGAAMARELGIPCVVGCREAWTRLAEGQLVEVDGAAGRVVLIESPERAASRS